MRSIVTGARFARARLASSRSGDTDVSGLIEEFPRHLAVEIANNWKVVEGPTTHRRMQAFPSIAHPGSWSTARRQEDALYIVVVPELNGLGPQMVNQLNLWLIKNANVPPTADLVSACASVAVRSIQLQQCAVAGLE